MSICLEILKRLSISLDEPLTSEAQAEVEAHLAICPACKTAWTELQWAHRQIKGAEILEPPPWLTEKIMARVRKESAPHASFWRRSLLPLTRRPSFQMAALLLVGITGYYLVKTRPLPPVQETSAPPPAADTRQSKTEAAPSSKVTPHPESPRQPTTKPQAQPAFAPAPTAGAAMAKRAEANQATAAPSAADAVAPAPDAPARSAAGAAARAEPKAQAEASTPSLTIIRLRVTDPDAARTLVEQELDRVGATRLPSSDPRQVEARLDARRLPELLQGLAHIGPLVEPPAAVQSGSAWITVSIRW